MFDSYSRNSYNNPQTVNINAVGGTIVKNYKDSFILRFNMQSEMARLLLDKEPELTKRKIYHDVDSIYHRGYTEEIKEPVVVLQVMLCGEQELLAEVMWKEDFDKMYEPQTECREQGITKEDFKAKAKAVIDTERFGALGVLFDYESFEEMKVAQIPDGLDSSEADMSLDDFLDKLYERIKGDLK